MAKSDSKYILRCVWCKSTFAPESKARSCSSCNGSLEFVYDYELLRDQHKGIPSSNRPGIWRFAPLLPVRDEERSLLITLGEGRTPYRRLGKAGAESGSNNLFVKDESRNPTCSFKDRKSACAITKAKEEGYSKVVAATAGNAGSSVAAYAAVADIDSYILAFQGISETKLSKLLAYNAHVFLTSASTGDVLEFVDKVCKEFSMQNCSAASRYNPYVKEGAKTAVFEIYEDTKGEMPDWIILPVGGGGNIAAYYKGLTELKSMGLLENYPKLVGVQGSGCAPVAEAFEKKLDPRNIPKVKNPHTIAHSILDDWAPDGDLALVAMRETNGTAATVTDEEIITAMNLLAGREAIYCEPSSAAPLAALKNLLNDKTIGRDETVTIVCTGFGLNQPEATINSHSPPNKLSLDIAEFGKYI